MLKHVAALACLALVLPAGALAGRAPTISGAPLLGAGQTARGGAVPYDFFRISLEEGQHLHLVWDTMGDSCCIRVRIYPPSVTDQSWRHEHPAYGQSIARALSLSSFTANAAGLWTLQVSAAHRVATAPYSVIAMINPCFGVNGGLFTKLKAYAKCAVALGKTALKCGFAVAALGRFPSRSLGLIKAAEDISVLRRLPARFRPLGRLLFHLYHAPIAKHAPQGFRSARELRDRIRDVSNGSDLVNLLPNLASAVGRRNFEEIGLDIALLAGLQSCGELVINTLE